MKILNLYFSSTGNTEKVAQRISATAAQEGHEVDTVKIAGEQQEDVDLLRYDLVFIGSGVYQWLPGKALQEFIGAKLTHYAEAKEIKPSRPGGPRKREWCTAPLAGLTPGPMKPSPR
jgi:menaquinone-dependent protoporphyrinogen IX oxidase